MKRNSDSTGEQENKRSKPEDKEEKAQSDPIDDLVLSQATILITAANINSVS